MRVSTAELLLVLLVIVVIFGPTQIPKLSKMLGKSVRNLRAGMSGEDGEPGAEKKAGQAEGDADEKQHGNE